MHDPKRILLYLSVGFIHNCLGLLNTTQWWFRWQKIAPDWLWGGLVHLNITALFESGSELLTTVAHKQKWPLKTKISDTQSIAAKCVYVFRCWSPFKIETNIYLEQSFWADLSWNPFWKCIASICFWPNHWFFLNGTVYFCEYYFQFLPWN